MLILILGLICSHSFDLDATRDSAIVQIKEGRWEQAYANARLVLTHEHEDYLMLGFLEFAESKNMVATLTMKFIGLLDESESKIIESWERIYEEDSLNVNIMQVLTVLYLRSDLEKAITVADRIIELDSLNIFGYFLHGHTNRMNGALAKALQDYHQVHDLDTTFTNALAMVANVHMQQSRCDSAITYFTRISENSEMYTEARICQIICNIKQGDYTLAESLLTVTKKMPLETRHIYELTVIENYLGGLNANKVSDKDTLIVFLPTHSEYTRLLHVYPTSKYRKILPTIWPVVVLTNQGVDFVYEVTELSEPELLHFPPPRYPQDLRERGIQGQVVISALIDTDGRVKHAEVSSSSGYKGFDDSALDVVRQVEFKPVRINGIPLRVWLSFPINFTLRHVW